MRLRHITFTGIDARTDLQELQDIQRQYPIAEFGVLTSYHWHENGNRYLNPQSLPNLYGRELNLALHICGSNGSTLYVTDMPCMECSKLIIQAGIRRVVYERPYRIEDGVKLLERAGIEVVNIPSEVLDRGVKA